ncbi:MAG: type 4a pilus biogenesis protein PilO [Deltaproteobacteria bacterium]|nr:type 4a pilus biogenesis protein PilO [Deltaproteobacteria bacterium]
MPLSIKNLDRTCLAIVVTVSVICGYLAVSHIISQSKQIRQENELLSQRLKDLSLADTNLQRLKEVLDATKRELASLNEQIPETAKMGEFLKKVDSLMKEREVALVTLEPLSTVEERLYTKNPVRLIFEGSFVKVYQALHDLETMNRKVVMEKITIAKANKDQQCRVDLMASIFER